MPQSLTIEYADSLPDTLHLSRSQFEREARMAMAVKLFDMGRLTAGQAAELAGMPKVHFLYELGRWEVAALQTSAQDLEQDTKVAQGLYDRHQH